MGRSHRRKTKPPTRSGLLHRRLQISNSPFQPPHEALDPRIKGIRSGHRPSLQQHGHLRPKHREKWRVRTGLESCVRVEHHRELLVVDCDVPQASLPLPHVLPPHLRHLQSLLLRPSLHQTRPHHPHYLHFIRPRLANRVGTGTPIIYCSISGM